jgi:hypothetical protein
MNDYRPLTLLNTDLKLLTRIIVNRFRPWIPDLITPDQHCGLAGMTVFDALATVRDVVVAYAEYTKKIICVITLDFSSAFDNIKHDYLIATLHHHGFSDRMIRRIMNLLTMRPPWVKLMAT